LVGVLVGVGVKLEVGVAVTDGETVKVGLRYGLAVKLVIVPVGVIEKVAEGGSVLVIVDVRDDVGVIVGVGVTVAV
jgi:hypothetical protein